MKRSFYYMIREVGTENYISHTGGMGAMTTNPKLRHVFKETGLETASREKVVVALAKVTDKKLEAVDW